MGKIFNNWMIKKLKQMKNKKMKNKQIKKVKN